MKVSEIFRCSHCGLQVEITAAAPVNAPVCCGEAMQLQTPNTNENGAKEKHIPVLSDHEGGILVKVGEVTHPMTEEHYIEWIEVINGNYVNRYNLKPGDLPQAAFYVARSPKLVVRADKDESGIFEDEQQNIAHREP